MCTLCVYVIMVGRAVLYIIVHVKFLHVGFIFKIIVFYRLISAFIVNLPPPKLTHYLNANIFLMATDIPKFTAFND